MADDFVRRQEYLDNRRDTHADINALKADFRVALSEALLPLLSQLDRGREELKGMKVQLQLQNGRIGRLENWRWALIGAGAVIYWAADKVIR